MKKIGLILLILCFSILSLEAATQEEVDKMLTNLHWLGHASFRLDLSKTIYFDPWKLSANPKKADIIFISHEHFDHFSKDDIALISTENTVIVTDKTVSKQLEEKVTCKKIETLLPGDSIDIEDVKVKAVASYNTNKEFHTNASKKLGFIVTIDGVAIYHSGDTDNIPEMKDYACDIALLPVSGTYVMTADEAANAALAIKPKVAVPMHYGDIVGSEKDAERFKELLKGKIEVKILLRNA